ncbi:MAG: hypothetical protein IJZ87_08775 [Bacteroidales bacterium]|nr:hypothetical protein [Bacteroidales bacterium]
MDRNNILGVEIEYTYQGSNSLMSYNSNIKWAKHIGEIAEIKQLKKPDNQSWDFLLLQKIDCGHIIRIYCANAGRNDYMCASIFVPWNIVISGKELAKIIDITKTELLNWNKDTSKTKLEKIFSETICDVVDIQQSSLEVSSNKVAYRFYGEYYQLHELLDNLDQPCYSSYKFVFLIDKSSNIECETCDDLTEKDFVGSAIINPPKTCNGFKPYIGDKPFEKSIKKNFNTILNVSWKRDGYKTIEKITQISNCDVVLNLPTQNEYRILVPYNSIVVKDKKGNRIDQYTLMINKETILPNQNAEIVEESISNVEVIVSVNGYEQHRANKDLRNSCEVKLEKIKKTYRFIITHITKYKKIEFETEKDLCESPIEGYKTTNGKVYPDYDNQLVYKPFTKKHIMILLILVLLSLCVGGCAGWFVKSYFSKSDTKNNNTEITSLKKELLTLKKVLENKEKEISDLKNDLKNKPNVNSNHNSNDVTSNPSSATKPEVSVIDYLDNNEKWNRNEMEKYPETKGLWDAMNERRFDDILKYRDELSASHQFLKIFKCVENNRYKTGLGKYITKDSDLNITIKKYIEALDNASSPEPKKENKVKENKDEKKTTETNNAESYV